MGGFFWVFLAAFAWLFWLTEKAEGLLSWLWNLLFLLAGFEALYGLIQVLVPDVGVLWFASESYRGMARGTFINKNHYAAFLGMLWPLLLARVLTLRDGPPQRAEFPLRELSYTEKERRKQTKHKQLFLSFIIGLVLLAIVFSQSRGGAVAVLIAMTVFTLVGKTRRKGLLAAVVGLWVVVLSYGAIMGFDAVLERFNRMEDDAPGRFQVWQDTVRIMGDYPWTGTGLGTYPATIRVYQTSLPANIDYVHAHGDYFEIASELGLPAAMLLMLLVWGFWWNRAWRLVRRASLESGGGVPGDRERKRLIGVGALAGCAAFLCHSIVEFNWQIPANQLYFVTLLVLMRSGGWERVYGNE
jgi:O-antigen ligase